MIDLHTHTTASDGSDAPAALVGFAAAAGIRYLSITDHDTVAAYDDALPAAAEAGVDLLPGVELSLQFAGGTLHLLGYGIDPAHEAIQRALGSVQTWRLQRNDMLIDRLAEAGLPVDRPALEALSGGGQIGRPHIARLLVQRGTVATVQEAFDRYLGDGTPFHIPKPKLSPADGMGVVRAAGGLPVLAHPYQLRLDAQALAAKVAEWVAMGLGGIEAYYSQHSREQVADYAALAERHGLVVTAGSDYHGVSKPHIALGEVPRETPDPAGLMARLRAALEAVR